MVIRAPTLGSVREFLANTKNVLKLRFKIVHVKLTLIG